MALPIRPDADVSGRYFYNNDYIPMLVARYMDAAE